MNFSVDVTCFYLKMMLHFKNKSDPDYQRWRDGVSNFINKTLNFEHRLRTVSSMTAKVKPVVLNTSVCL